jgi:hypothetical protein
MKRVGLKTEFHGEPDPNQEGIVAEFNEHDEVVMEVTGGTVSLVVPSRVPDDQVMQDKYLERFVACTLTLENGAQLLIWINAGAHGVEVQVEPPHRQSVSAANRLLLATTEEWR